MIACASLGCSAVIVAAGLAAAIALQVRRDTLVPRGGLARRRDLTSRPATRSGGMALSFKPLLADVYWIRAVQYFGGTRLDMKRAA